MAKGHLDELQMAEIVNTSKMVPLVITKAHYSINHIYYRGGRYRQVSLYFAQCPSWGSNRETSDVHHDVVANTSTVASVLASSHPI